MNALWFTPLLALLLGLLSAYYGALVTLRYAEVTRETFKHAYKQKLSKFLLKRMQTTVHCMQVLCAVVLLAIGWAYGTALIHTYSFAWLLIFGVLLLMEKTFTVGDRVQIGTLQGIVESVDFLSTKLKTLENHYIRVPNEQILKSPVINLSRYPKVCIKLRVWTRNNAAADTVRLDLQNTLARHYTLNGETLLKENINETLIFEQGFWVHNAEADRVKTAILEQLHQQFGEHLRRAYFL